MAGGPWKWFTWHWRSGWGRDVQYSLPHLMHPDALPGHPKTACGVAVGGTVIENNLFEPPEHACSKCLAAWRKHG